MHLIDDDYRTSLMLYNNSRKGNLSFRKNYSNISGVYTKGRRIINPSKGEEYINREHRVYYTDFLKSGNFTRTKYAS